MYNTRNSYSRNQNQQARHYNNPGTFVAASPKVEPAPPQQGYQTPQNQNQNQSQTVTNNAQQPPLIHQSAQQAWQQQEAVEAAQAAEAALNDVKDESFSTVADESVDLDENGKPKKRWLKKGYKVSMREKRRRQNKQLRRLLTPKNALMVLNELAPGSQHECSVTAEGDAYGAPVSKQYVAVLSVKGVDYKGMGSTKLLAKNSAAESVIRDMIIKQMGGIPITDTQPTTPEPVSTEEKMDTEEDKSTESEPSFPMIQLASYALHKLFAEWQTEGFKVPQLGTATKPESIAGGVVPAVPANPPKPKKTPTLPPSAEHLHPCMLLSQMRAGLEYTFLASEGVKPNSQIFTMGVNVDGTTYIGKATSKKEGRRLAAKKACEEVFGIVYPDDEKQLPIEEL